MDRVSAWMVRASLCWLVLGVTVGAVMMSDVWLPGRWRVWMAPSHGHMLFVGWFLQFALGIGIWLLPRTRSDAKPLGYREGRTAFAVVALNAGLLLRVWLEPVQRSGNDSSLYDPGLLLSSLLQLAAVGLIVIEIWPRVAARTPRKRVDTITRSKDNDLD